MRQLRFARREGDRQPTRRIDRAGQNVGDRLAALLAGIPGFDDGGRPIEPGHENRPARLEHDHRARIGPRDALDQPVLPCRAGSNSARRRSPSSTGRRTRRPRRRRPRPSPRAPDRGRRRIRRARAETSWRIASSGDDGSKIIARFFPSGSLNAIPPRGTTCDEPPPDGTPRSAWAPTTRIGPASAGSGNRPSFRSSTAPSCSMASAVASLEGEVGGIGGDGVVGKAAGEDRRQNPPRHVVEPRLRDFALRRPRARGDRKSSACRAARPIPDRARPSASGRSNGRRPSRT